MEDNKEVNIYELYGKLMIQRELLDSQILEVKRQIVEDMNKNNKKDNKTIKEVT